MPAGDMTDREFLMWLHERLEHVHQESPMTDYMRRFRAIIASTPKASKAPNMGEGRNSLGDLRAELENSYEDYYTDREGFEE